MIVNVLSGAVPAGPRGSTLEQGGEREGTAMKRLREDWSEDEDDYDDEEDVDEREALKRLRKSEEEDCDEVENDDTGENENGNEVVNDDTGENENRNEEDRDNEEENNNEEGENNEEEENNEEGEEENDDEDDRNENEEGDAEEDESDEDGINVDEHDNGDQDDLPGRRKLRNRKVNCLENALNPANYSPYIPPSTRKIVSGVLKKKRRDVPEVTISWSNQPPSDRRGPGRRPATHIVDPRAGTVIGRAKEAMTEAEVFSLFFDEDILSLIINYTNRKIQNYNNEEENRQKQVATTDLVELRGFLGLFYMRAFFRIVHKTWGPHIHH